MKYRTRITSFLSVLFISAVYLTATAQEGTVETITYNSTTQNTSCNMNVYFPAGYDDAENAGKSYPVFYLIHGGEIYMHWLNPTAATDNNSGKEILAYPNPAISNVQIVNIKEKSEVSIYARDGKLVLHKTAVRNNELLNIEQLPAGTYTLQIQNKEQYYQTTLLIEN